ncbi:MAG: hypothetical protein J2P22_02320 [Nocardioides sp.]|nr:hypothetical protein [Nocardioides sp.]
MEEQPCNEPCDHMYSLYFAVEEADGSLTWVGECVECHSPGAMNVDHDLDVHVVA